jgi:ABC-2 type transport system ATP-binding protein
MLEVRAITKRYPGVTAVRDVSFSVAPGEVLGYLGPNGSGKTTTVSILTGLLEPTRGHVFYHGRDIATDLVEFRRHVGYVPEEPHLYPFLSGREYLQLVGRLREIPEKTLERSIEGMLQLFSLGTDGELGIGSYSKGMKQKILIIAALLHDPDIIIFDEPLSGLDVTAAMVFRHLVHQLAQAGKTILYSSHVLEVVEKLCSRVVVLHRGVVVADDSVERLRERLVSDSLEEVFAQLVFREDPEQVARNIAGVIAAGH